MNTAIKSLQELVNSNYTVNIVEHQLHPKLIIDIQKCLRVNADGIVGNITKQALADFKLDNHLQFPYLIGKTTAQELLEEREVEDKNEDEHSTNIDLIKPLPSEGSRTGRKITLPNGDIVYQNQYMIAGIPLTWGEMLKGGTRVPTINEYVQNGLRFARTWGWVRDKFGNPIYISSGFRPPHINRQVGGSRNSQHQYFLAGDMIPLNGQFRKLWEVLLASEFVGLGDAVFSGRNKGFFHADLRKSGQRVIFPY